MKVGSLGREREEPRGSWPLKMSTCTANSNLPSLVLAPPPALLEKSNSSPTCDVGAPVQKPFAMMRSMLGRGVRTHNDESKTVRTTANRSFSSTTTGSLNAAMNSRVRTSDVDVGHNASGEPTAISYSILLYAHTSASNDATRGSL
jgi:hypothetical protein